MLQHNHLILKGTIKKVPTADDLVETSLWIEDFIMGNGMQLASKLCSFLCRGRGK